MKIRFDFIANGLIFSLIRDTIRNIAKGGRSHGGKLQKTVPSDEIAKIIAEIEVG